MLEKASVNCVKNDSKLDDIYLSLGVETDKRYSIFAKRTKQWQESEKGETYNARTEQIAEASCLVARAGDLLQGNE